MSIENYSVSGDFSSGVDIGQLQDEILAETGITTNLISVNRDDDDINIEFSSAISAPEKILLDAIIAAHIPGVAVKILNDVSSNLEAIVDPTINDDLDFNYGPGSSWINIANGKEFVCFDGTDGAAIWKQRTNVGISSASKSFNFPFKARVDQKNYTRIFDITWDNTEYSSFTSGVVRFNCTVVDRDLNIQANDGTILGSITAASSGVKNFPISKPITDGTIEIRVKKSSVGGTSPFISGITVDFI